MIAGVERGKHAGRVQEPFRGAAGIRPAGATEGSDSGGRTRDDGQRLPAADEVRLDVVLEWHEDRGVAVAVLEGTSARPDPRCPCMGCALVNRQ